MSSGPVNFINASGGHGRMGSPQLGPQGSSMIELQQALQHANLVLAATHAERTASSGSSQGNGSALDHADNAAVPSSGAGAARALSQSAALGSRKVASDASGRIFLGPSPTWRGASPNGHATGTLSERNIGMHGRRGSVPIALPVSDLSAGIPQPRTRTMSNASQLPLPLSENGSSRRGSLSSDWAAHFEFSSTEGTGVSACEEAGYIFGAQENGVRGKAGTPGFWAPEMVSDKELRTRWSSEGTTRP